MALCWGFIVAIFAILAGFAESQTSTTVTASPSITTSTSLNTPHSATTSTPAATTATATTSTPAGGLVTATGQIVATATMSVASSSSTTSPKLGFNLNLMVSFKSTNGCNATKDQLIESEFKSFFMDRAKFDLEEPIKCYVTEREDCLYNCSIKFGPKLTIYNNISEVFHDKFKNRNATLKLSDMEIKVHVPGITLGEKWEAEAEECKKKCCEGAGGPITVRRECEPPNHTKCERFKKEVPDCNKFCTCSGVIVCKISLLVLLCGTFMNWFLK